MVRAIDPNEDDEPIFIYKFDGEQLWRHGTENTMEEQVDKVKKILEAGPASKTATIWELELKKVAELRTKVIAVDVESD